MSTTKAGIMSEIEDVLAREEIRNLVDIIISEQGTEHTKRALECYIRERPDFFPQS